MNTSDVGSLAELYAMIYLMRKDLLVFRNISPAGKVDMVSVNRKTGAATLYDIKVISKKKNGARYATDLTKEQHRIGVKLLLVDRDTGQVVDDGKAYRRIPNSKRVEFLEDLYLCP